MAFTEDIVNYTIMLLIIKFNTKTPCAGKRNIETAAAGGRTTAGKKVHCQAFNCPS